MTGTWQELCCSLADKIFCDPWVGSYFHKLNKPEHMCLEVSAESVIIIMADNSIRSEIFFCEKSAQLSNAIAVSEH